MKTILVAATLAVTLAYSPAYAEPTPGDRANALLLEGEQLADQGKWTEARGKLEEAFALKPSYDIAGNLALVEDELGDHASAATHLDYALHTFPATAKPEHKKTLDEQFKLVRAKVAALRLTVTPDGASMTVDGKPTEIPDAGRDLYLAPGEHTIVLSRDGFEPSKKVEKVMEGEALERSVALTKAVAIEPAQKPAWPYVVGVSVGVAGLGLGIGMAVAAALKSGDATDLAAGAACKPVTASCLTEGQSLADSADTFDALAIVGFSVAGAALTATIIYAAVPAKSSKPSTTVTAAPLLAPGFQGLMLFGTF